MLLGILIGFIAGVAFGLVWASWAKEDNNMEGI